MRNFFVTTLLIIVFHAASAQNTLTCPEVEAHAEDFIEQGLDEWLFNQTDFMETFPLDTVLPHLGRLHNAFASQGVHLVAAVVPSRGMLHAKFLDRSKARSAAFSAERASSAYETFIAQLQSTGIYTPNLLRAALASPQVDQFFFKHDHHWRPVGAHIAAQALGEMVRGLPNYASLEKQAFSTRVVATERNGGARATRLDEVCGGRTPQEPFERTVTTPVTQGSLLGDAAIPQVVLLGTSLSNRNTERLDYNFQGYLAEALMHDVLNVAVGGGGPATAMQAYLLSDEYIQDKPAVIIWEFPIWQVGRLTSVNHYRQSIPSVYGSCSAETSLAQTSLPVSGGELTLFDLGASNLQGSGYYLSFELSDPTLVSFTIRNSHSNGRDDAVQIERSTRVQNSGRFFLEFSDAIAAPIQSVTLVTPAGASGTVEARVCAVPR